MAEWLLNEPAPNGVEEAWGAWFSSRCGSVYTEPMKVEWFPSWGMYVATNTEEEATADKLSFGDCHSYVSTDEYMVQLVIDAWKVYHKSIVDMFTKDNETMRNKRGDS